VLNSSADDKAYHAVKMSPTQVSTRGAILPHRLCFTEHRSDLPPAPLKLRMFGST